MKNKMRNKALSIIATVTALVLVGCAGQPMQYQMEQPAAQPNKPPSPQTITFPNGTVFGGASANQASSLAQIMVEANNNNMKDYEELQGAQAKNLAVSSKNLQTSQQALRMLEQLSDQQGTGQITLFFPTGSATLPSTGLQYDRLVNFLDYLSRDSRGRKVIFVMIGSASATGSLAINEKLSRERSQAPEPIINQYLVNVPHEFYKVYGLGDVYAPKNVTLQEDQRYQNVRIIAVYDTNQIPALKS
jgi:outer membrane protein OmpA-like peptidoglycan-associated protein